MSDISGIGSGADAASLQAANAQQAERNLENQRQAQRAQNKENSSSAPKEITKAFDEAQTAEKVRAQRTAAQQDNARVEQTTRQAGETTQAQDQNARRLAAEAEQREDPAPSGTPGNVEQVAEQQAALQQIDSALGNNVDLQA